MLTLDLLTRANDGFTQRVALVRPDQWSAPTPCEEWHVRALVNHVGGANRSADHLGDAPVASFVATAAELNQAIREPGAMARTAHHPAGERTGAQLLEMRVLDVRSRS